MTCFFSRITFLLCRRSALRDTDWMMPRSQAIKCTNSTFWEESVHIAIMAGTMFAHEIWYSCSHLLDICLLEIYLSVSGLGGRYRSPGSRFCLCLSERQRLYSLLNVFKAEILNRSAFSYHLHYRQFCVILNNPRTGMCYGIKLKIYKYLHIYELK